MLATDSTSCARHRKTEAQTEKRSNNNNYETLPFKLCIYSRITGERGGSVVECRTPEREVRGSRPTAAVLCP